MSVDYDDWRFNVRSSNTEPLLRLCLESLVSVRQTWSAAATRSSASSAHDIWRNTLRVSYHEPMPVETADKVIALSCDFQS